MSQSNWKTAITDIGPNQIRVKGYDIADIMSKLSYAETVFLVLKGAGKPFPDPFGHGVGQNIDKFIDGSPSTST